MAHQDKDLELRAMFEEAPNVEKKLESEDEKAAEATPLAIDHDAVPSWRETARFFRKAA